MDDPRNINIPNAFFGKPYQDKQHLRGKLNAYERISLLLDVDSFEEIGSYVSEDLGNSAIGDGVVTGKGLINGRLVFVYSQDFNVSGGTVSETNAMKICRIMDLALKTKSPVIGINDSGGARIQDGVMALSGYGEIFQRNVNCSGVIPQISLIMGPCAGGAVYSPALTDFIFMTRNTAFMFVTGPNIVKKVLHQDVTKEELGGFALHSSNGVVDMDFEHDIDLILNVRKFLSFIPSSNVSKVPFVSGISDDKNCSILNKIIPDDHNIPYDVKEVIYNVVDYGDFFELSPGFAANIVVGFGRMGGFSVGIVANQPLELAGCLDVDSSKKAARFIRFCDAFNIPIVTFVDVPGFMPGLEQERNAIIKNGAKLLYAYAEATVPKISVILRKSYGGAYIVMSSKHLCSDVNYAWSTAEIAVMGAEGAVEIIFRNEIKDPKKSAYLVEEYRKKYANPYIAASKGFIDDVIQPDETRIRIINALRSLKSKAIANPFWKKHDNLPL